MVNIMDMGGVNGFLIEEEYGMLRIEIDAVNDVIVIVERLMFDRVGKMCDELMEEIDGFEVEDRGDVFVGNDKVIGLNVGDIIDEMMGNVEYIVGGRDYIDMMKIIILKDGRKMVEWKEFEKFI